MHVIANPGRWLHVSGRVELRGDVVIVDGVALADVIRGNFLPELELAGDPLVVLGELELQVQPAPPSPLYGATA